MDYLNIAKKYYLNLIEVSVLVYLNMHFLVQELTSNQKVYLHVEKSTNELIKKGFIIKIN